MAQSRGKTCSGPSHALLQNMKWSLLTKDETGEEIVCGLCNKLSNEVYTLKPEDDIEYKLLQDKLGDTANWSVCEKCFGGYCLRLNEFLEVLKSATNKMKGIRAEGGEKSDKESHEAD